MGVMDKFLTYMKLNDVDDDTYYDEDYYDEEEPVNNDRKIVKPFLSKGQNNTANDASARDNAPMAEEEKRQPAKMPASLKRKNIPSGMEVCIIKPTSMEDGQEIAETLISRRTVVLNLEGLDVELAQRIIDFTCGSTFSLQGHLQKISRYIFVVTPPGVDISGDFQDVLSAAGSFDIPGFQ